MHGHLHFLDEAKVVYPCGHNVVIYNTETRDQVLIHGMHGSGAGGGASAMPTLHSEGITAMAVTPNRRLIAVAERCSERGVVNLYDAASLKRRRMLNYADLGSREVVWVAFSQDSRSILTLGGAPDWTLVLWTSDRTAKVLATLKLNTQQPAAAPSQPVNSAPSPGIDRQNSTVPSSPMAVRNFGRPRRKSAPPSLTRPHPREWAARRATRWSLPCMCGKPTFRRRILTLFA